MNILLTNNRKPLGGKWSLDQENRARLPATLVLPKTPKTAQTAQNSIVERSIAEISESHTNVVGSAGAFRWAVTHEQAEAWLELFVDERLKQFGKYEDAISTSNSFLFHSVLTPMLNIGLLSPQQVIDRVVKETDRMPLNSIEGFVRQIIGWREFMRGMYSNYSCSMRNSNFWKFTHSMPSAFYSAETGITPVDRVISKLKEHAYVHHIERLMVLGCFMLLCRIKPDDVCKWFMEFFIDSYDWVMVPNVYGMSQFADGGSFSTKPYICSSNYILKMSNEAKGDWCRIWDCLYWKFVADFIDVFKGNGRMAMMANMYHSKSSDERADIDKVATAFLSKLHSH
jgi:deoxyribodipyrimidine photolyase-related protein